MCLFVCVCVLVGACSLFWLGGKSWLLHIFKVIIRYDFVVGLIVKLDIGYSKDPVFERGSQVKHVYVGERERES